MAWSSTSADVSTGVRNRLVAPQSAKWAASESATSASASCTGASVAGDVLGRDLLHEPAEGRGLADALLEQRPGRLPVGHQVVVLVEQLEARASGLARVDRVRRVAS